MSLSRNINETIQQQYITPFLNNVRAAQLDEAEAIRSLVYIFHRYQSALFTQGMLSLILKNDKTLKHNPLLATPSCHASLLNLARLYFVIQEQEKIIPKNVEEEKKTRDALGGDNIIPMAKQLLANMPIIEIQTRIRDMLFAEVNPIPYLSVTAIKEMLPDDNKNATVLYALSNPVVLKEKKLHLFSVSRKQFPNGELLASINDTYDVQLFTSLYQATEWAHFESSEVSKKTMHPIWAVAFNGDIESVCRGTLQFNSLYRPSLCCRGMGVAKKEVIPLRGVLVQVNPGFANLQVLSAADLPYKPVERLENVMKVKS